MISILVIRLSALGDVAMTLPVLRSVLKSNQDIKITMVTSKGFTSLFENIDRLQVIAVDTKGRHKGLWGILKLKKELTKGGKYDYVIDLHDVLRSSILSFLFRITGTGISRIDKGRKEKKLMIQTKALKPLTHTTERYCHAFQKAGIKVNEHNLTTPTIEITEANNQAATKFLLGHSGHFIAFAPFAKHLTKTFPLHKSEELIEALIKNYTVFLLGGPEDFPKMQEWEKKYKQVYSTSALSLTGQIALINRMDAVISMDSANMHLAAIQGKRTISIWGATHPYFGFSGLNTDPSTWISSNIPIACRPCSVFGNKPCSNIAEPYACLEKINISQILSAI